MVTILMGLGVIALIVFLVPYVFAGGAFLMLMLFTFLESRKKNDD